jgi:MFS family permease
VTVGGVAWATGSWYQGRAGQRLAARTRLRLGMALIAAGVATAALCVSAAVPVWVCVLGWTVGGLGMGVLYPTVSALTLKLSPPGEQGANSSALQLSDSLFSTAVLAVGGSLFAALLEVPSLAYSAAFALAFVLALLGVFVTLHDRDRASHVAMSTADSRTVHK